MTEEVKVEENEEVVEEVKVEEVVEEVADEAKALDEAAEKLGASIKKMIAEAFEEKETKEVEANATIKADLYSKKEDVSKMSKEEKAITFIQAILNNDKVKLQPLSEGTAANGGYLVPEEWHTDIVTNINDNSVVRSRATVIPILTDTYHVTSLASQPRVGWRSELAAKQTTTANFGEITLTPYSLAAIIPVSQELADDASVGMPAGGIYTYLTNLMSEQIALKEDLAFLTGSGTGQPTGITSYTLGYQPAAAVTGDALINLFHHVKPADRVSACWIMSSQAVAEVRKIKDTTNRYLFAEALTADGFPTLMAKPVLETDQVGRNILFGNLKAYFIADRTSREGGRISVRVSDQATVGGYSMFERNEVAIRVEERTDGELTRVQAFGKITSAY